MMDVDRAQRADRARHHRGRAARLHARPHAQRRLRHPRRGAEHHHRADEDVPHPPRLRLQGGDHRRRDPGRPAAGKAVGPDATRCRSSTDMEGIRFCEFTERDVVRHPLVQEIVRAYDVARPRREAEQAAKKAATGLKGPDAACIADSRRGARIAQLRRGRLPKAGPSRGRSTSRSSSTSGPPGATPACRCSGSCSAIRA